MIRHVELFAGIGGFRQALETLGHDFALPQTTVAYSEIDPHAVQTYEAAHQTQNEIRMGDLVSFCRDESALGSLPDFNLLTGGFPCQAFSMMGKQRGFADARGSVFFEVIRILREHAPRFVLLENVRNLASHNRGATLDLILSSLRKAGYPHVFYDVFDTKDFGLAQTRNRVFIFATQEVPPDFEFSAARVKAAFDRLPATSLVKQRSTHEILDRQADEKFYLSDRIKPTILANGSASFVAQSEINNLIARPLTATMAKMHRACQDNYFSDGYIASTDPETYVKHQFTKEELARQRIRRLTPGEAFLLQGFNREFVASALSTGVSNTQLYKQAGNAVSVNTVYAILYYLLRCTEWKEKS